MRRHPIAVYRIIDEEELLGGGDFELTSRRELPAGGIGGRPLRREQRRTWGGWGSTTLGVIALACVAVLLLDVTPRPHAPAPASSRHADPATPAPRVGTVVAPAGLPSHTRTPAPRLAEPSRVVIVRRRPRVSARHAVARATRARVAAVVLVSRPGGSAARRAPLAAEQEFGFER